MEDVIKRAKGFLADWGKFEPHAPRYAAQIIDELLQLIPGDKGWLDIRIAPKDGTPILTVGKDFGHKILWRNSKGKENDTGRAGWIDGSWDWKGDESYNTFEPTHWRWLPDLPTTPSLAETQYKEMI